MYKGHYFCEETLTLGTTTATLTSRKTFILSEEIFAFVITPNIINPHEINVLVH